MMLVQVLLAGTIVCIVCNLVMLVVFGGEAGSLLPGKEVGEPQVGMAQGRHAQRKQARF